MGRWWRVSAGFGVGLLLAAAILAFTPTVPPAYSTHAVLYAPVSTAETAVPVDVYAALALSDAVVDALAPTPWERAQLAATVDQAARTVRLNATAATPDRAVALVNNWLAAMSSQAQFVVFNAPQTPPVSRRDPERPKRIAAGAAFALLFTAGLSRAFNWPRLDDSE